MNGDITKMVEQIVKNLDFSEIIDSEDLEIQEDRIKDLEERVEALEEELK